MLKRTAILSLLAAVFVWTAPANALMIDDFSKGGTNLAIDNILDTDAWWTLENGLPNANTYGTKRYSQLDWQPVAAGNPGDWATIDVNQGGSGVVDFARVGDPRWWFGYGERAFDLTWDKDWSGPGEDLLKITLGGNGAPESLRINFYIHGTIGGVAKYLNDLQKVGLKKVQQVLRHRKQSTTEIYVEGNYSDTREAMTLLEMDHLKKASENSLSFSLSG